MSLLDESANAAIATRFIYAVNQCNQMKTVFVFCRETLLRFETLNDEFEDNKLRNWVNFSALLGDLDGKSKQDAKLVIPLASKDIATVRLPRLLCIALVSIIETAFKDLCIMMLPKRYPQIQPTKVKSEVNKWFNKGAKFYLAKMMDEFNFQYLADADWDEYYELNATRNMLVHKSDFVVHRRYVNDAGPKARAKEGDILTVDDNYFLHAQGKCTRCLFNFMTVTIGSGNKQAEW